MNAPVNWQLWNQLQAAALTAQVRAAGNLAREINRVLDIGADSLECREWASLRRQLRQVAPAIAGGQLLQQLQIAEAFIAGFEGDEAQDGIADMLAGIRAAIAAATLKDACHQAEAVPA